MDTVRLLDAIREALVRGGVSHLESGKGDVIQNEGGVVREARFFNRGSVLYYGSGDVGIPFPVCDAGHVEGVSFATEGNDENDRFFLFIDLTSARIRYECDSAGIDGFTVVIVGGNQSYKGEKARRLMCKLTSPKTSVEYAIESLVEDALWRIDWKPTGECRLSPRAVCELEKKLRSDMMAGGALATARYLMVAAHALEDEVRASFDVGLARRKAVEGNAVETYVHLLLDEFGGIWEEYELQEAIESIALYAIASSCEE